MAMQSPHDALFKQVFSVPSEAAAEFCHVLPEAVSREIDWRSLRSEPGSFVDEELRDRHADPLFSATYGSKRVLLYCLLEHKSTLDLWTPLQVLIYTMRIWERHRRESPNLELPAVFTVVVYHGPRPWSGPRELVDLIAVPPSERERFEPYQPRCPFLIDDLAAETPESLRRRRAGVFARVVLFCLKRVRESPDILAELALWGDALRSIAQAPGGVAALTALLSYIMEVRDVPVGRVRQFLRIEVDPTMESPVFTMIDFLKEKFRDEGRQEGLEQGRQEGRNEGQAELFLRLLRARFPDALDRFASRVEQAGDAELATWAERLLKARSLEDVFDA